MKRLRPAAPLNTQDLEDAQAEVARTEREWRATGGRGQPGYDSARVAHHMACGVRDYIETRLCEAGEHARRVRLGLKVAS